LASFLSRDKLKIVRSKFSTLPEEEFELLTRKGAFPYEYISCVEKLQDTCLAPRESFYSLLTGDTVSESDYAHTVNVWQRFFIQMSSCSASIVICIWKLMSCYWQTFSKISAKIMSRVTISIPHIITLCLVSCRTRR